MSKASKTSLALTALAVLLSATAFAQSPVKYQGGIIPLSAAPQAPQIGAAHQAPGLIDSAPQIGVAAQASASTASAPQISAAPQSPRQTLESLAAQADAPTPPPAPVSATIGPPLATPATLQAQMNSFMPPKVEEPPPALRALEGGSQGVTAKLAYAGFVYSVHPGEQVGPSGWTLVSIQIKESTVSLSKKVGKKTVDKTLYLAAVDPTAGSAQMGGGSISGLPGLPPLRGPMQTFKAIPGMAP
jgi:hypothetical protein